MDNIHNQIQSLKDFYHTNKTRSYQFRYNALSNLKNSIKYYESDIIKALKLDLNKSEFESYMSEIGLIYNEISHTLKHLKQWMKVRKVPTPYTLFYSKSYIISEPLGLVLIISPWNYPLQLSLIPLIGAIASGNVAIIKPSEYTPNTNQILRQIITKSAMNDYVSIIEGEGSVVVPQLINTNLFEHVFFTGSTNVGMVVANLCSSQLIPYTLELGGKNPAIIDANCDLDVCAKRIIWAKFFNSGQTCIAPDYILVSEVIKVEFINKLKHYINKFYGDNQADLVKIINQNRFNHLLALLKDVDIICGGDFDNSKLFISPTLVAIDNLDIPIMQEEIFGPILPIISYQTQAQIYSIVAKNPYPLALYIFSKNKQFIHNMVTNNKFGGGCINTALVHFANYNLPFSGIRYSGIGKYHAKYTFDLFSHTKSIVDMSTKIDISIKYPPYNWLKLKLLKLFSK